MPFVSSHAMKALMTDQTKRSDQAWVKPFSDYGPIVVFFVAYLGWDLLVATAALMGATAIALVISLAINKRVPLMPLITAGVVGVFGRRHGGARSDRGAIAKRTRFAVFQSIHPP